MNISNSLKGHLAVFFAYIFLGSNFMFVKVLMPEVLSPMAFFFTRIWGIIPFAFILYLFKPQKIKRKHFIPLLVSAIMIVTISNHSYFYGLNLTSPVDASILMTCTPIFALFFSVLAKHEKFSLLKIIGVIVGGIGAVVLILYGSKSGNHEATLKGNLAFLLTSLAYGAYIVASKPIIQNYNAATSIFWIFFLGGLTIIPVVYEPVVSTDWLSISTKDYLMIGYTVLIATLLAYSLAIYSLKHLPPSVSSSYIYIQPVTVFVMILFSDALHQGKNFKDDFSWVKVFSCVLVFIGILIIIRGRKIELQKIKKKKI
ncbi:DMT family transporter [Aureivirga sp. CE67]|uniref:DMT family transporter n=1 Tax=Aureivirga sp. CE67 TaxID=1788983 RepID=UPI0018CA1E18|nr:DMT family transporter [Aureivirga sp. CE67]